MQKCAKIELMTPSPSHYAQYLAELMPERQLIEIAEGFIEYEFLTKAVLIRELFIAKPYRGGTGQLAQGLVKQVEAIAKDNGFTEVWASIDPKHPQARIKIKVYSKYFKYGLKGVADGQIVLRKEV